MTRRHRPSSGACCRCRYYQSVTLHQGFRTEELIDISVGHLSNYNASVSICGATVDQSTSRPSARPDCLRGTTRHGSTIHWRAFVQLFGEKSMYPTQTCLQFWAISRAQLLTVKPTLAVSVEKWRFDARRSAWINACLHRFDDNVYTTLEFLKAV